jgi:hypothetical protein
MPVEFIWKTIMKARNLIMGLIVCIPMLAPSGSAFEFGKLKEAALLAQLSNHDKSELSTKRNNSSGFFVENVGQFDPKVQFQVRRGEGVVWLCEDGIWLSIFNFSAMGSRDLSELNNASRAKSNVIKLDHLGGVNLKISYPGANPNPIIEPFDRMETHISYFIGRETTKWYSNIPVWKGMRYKDLYPGIDLELTIEEGKLVQRALLHRGVNANIIRLRVDGARDIALMDDQIRIISEVGDYFMPYIQIVGDSDRELKEPELLDNQIISPLVVDEAEQLSNSDSLFASDDVSDLLYSTFLGGSSYEYVRDLAIDASGNAYLTGLTDSNDFPTSVGAFDNTYNSEEDIFVVKLNRDGSELDYATFIGGFEVDRGNAIAVDQDGNAYITGGTDSPDFPTTSGVFDSVFSFAVSSAFVLKLNSTGTDLLYSTFLEGSEENTGFGVIASEIGEAYIIGETYSSDFPTTPGAFDKLFNGGSDIFVAKLSSTGADLIYSTYLGGSDFDKGNSIDVDPDGYAYLTGHTWSADFPITLSGYDKTYAGGDAFVVKLNVDGTGLTYSTFIGGSENEWANDISVGSNRTAFITGYTQSLDFPVTAGSFDTTYNGAFQDAFVAKLDANGNGLVYASFLGGTGGDQGNSISVGIDGSAYIVGDTSSSDFPTVVGAYDLSFNGSSDVFVVKVNPSATALTYSTFLGGIGYDNSYGSMSDSSGSAFVTGSTGSTDFPTTSGVFSRNYNDLFVSRLQIDNPSVQFGSNNYEITEIGPAATISVNLSGASGQAISVDYTTKDGTAVAGSDYISVSGTLNFKPGETSKTFQVIINDDGLDEPNETLNLELANPTNAKLGAVSSATLKILDNDQTIIYVPLIFRNYTSFFEGPWEVEDNDSFSQANGPLLPGKNYYGFHDDTSDYFSVYMRNAGLIKISLNSEHGKTDPNGHPVIQTQLFYSSTSNLIDYQFGPSAHIEHNGQPGWYYVRVFTVLEYLDSEKQYTLNVTYP